MKIKRINIIGAGSIGSFTALLLAKLRRYKLLVCDHDVVEAHNQRNQLYRASDQKKLKVVALKEITRKITGELLNARRKYVDEKSLLHGAVVVAVDSMKSRQMIFKACRYKADIPLYVEARAGGDGAIVYALDPRDPDHVEFYEDTLYDDKEAVAAPCANEENLPVLWTIASVIAKIIISAEKKIKIGSTMVVINFEGLPLVAGEEKEDRG